MSDSQVVHNTFVLEKSYPQGPEKVWAAFAQPERKRKWFAEGDHEMQQYELDFRVGGTEMLKYRFKEGHPIAGMAIENAGRYLDIAPGQRIVTAATMSLNGKLMSATLLTVEFAASGSGTAVTLTHQGAFVEWADGSKMLEVGWTTLLAKVAEQLAAA